MKELPEEIKKALPEEAQREFISIVHKNLQEYNGSENRAIAAAFAQLRKAGWARSQDGKWEKAKAPEQVIFKQRFDIAKVDEDQHLVFGWAYVMKDKDGNQVIDWPDKDGKMDFVEQEAVLEEMAYNFVLNYREGGEMHVKGGSATMIESIVFTDEKQKALGIPEKTVPTGWWIGFLVTDQTAWAGIKDGTYKSFSIEGTAIREEVEDE